MPDNCKRFLFRKMFDEPVISGNTANLVSYLKKEGKNVFLFNEFDINEFINSVNEYIGTELKQKTELNKFDNKITEINFCSENKLQEKLNLSEKYSLFFYTAGRLLKFAVLPEKYFEKNEQKSKFSIKRLINNPAVSKIQDYIYESVYEKYFESYPERKVLLNSAVTGEITLNEKVLAGELLENEKLLYKLNFKTTEHKNKQIEESFLLVGENTCFIIFLNQNNDLIDCEHIAEKAVVKKNFFRTKIITGKFKLTPLRKNTDIFIHLPEILEKKGTERIRNVAELSIFRKKYSEAKQILLYLIERENNPGDRFLLFLNEFKNNKEDIENFIRENNLPEIINEFLGLYNAESFLNNIFEQKKLTFEEKTILIYIVAESVENSENGKKIIPVYETIRKKFRKKNKNPTDKTVFDIKYSQFLIKTEEKRKARKILKKLLKNLPDETISDLLPPPDLNPVSENSGQLLKIKVLELLAATKSKDSSDDEIRKISLLQPLNEKITEKLISVKDEKLKQRAKEARNILYGNDLFSETDPACPVDYKPLSKEKIYNRLRHPSVTGKGKLYNIRKWISEIEEDDYTAVKNYSERIFPEHYNTLYAVLKNTGEVFGINDAEFYISKGKKSDEIIGYEAAPPYIILGNQYLDKNSPKYLNLCEIRFAVAAEFTHIYFKHTKLTTKDIWRGLAEKGAIAADAALAVIPVAGFLAGALKSVPKLNLVSKIFRGTASGLSSGKSAYDAALRLSEYYGKKRKPKKEKQKQKNLIAVSRLMQYTADRAGLLICGNLTSAVKSVLLTEKFDNDIICEIKASSLKEFLLRQNEDGTYKHQNTALRIANLFSFYFSEDYEVLRKDIKAE